VPLVDILVNNAGPIASRPFFDIADEEWQRFFDVYVLAAVRLARHDSHQMIERRWGRALFSAGVTSGFMSGEMVYYGAGKAALLGLSHGPGRNYGWHGRDRQRLDPRRNPHRGKRYGTSARLGAIGEDVRGG
jgi:NAD(P)-dependent dehydrogenase (short-subunit alcohol dehydrogenase family)